MMIHLIALQVIYLLGGLLLIPLFPVLIFQGRRIKKKIPILPEAKVNIHGEIGDGKNVINIVAIGESSVAGVGVEDHAKGLAGNIAMTLNYMTGKRVTWKVSANTGYSVEMVNKHLLHDLPSTIDVIVVSLGANDAFELKSPLQWRRGITRLIDAVRAKKVDCPIVITAMPPLGYFPAFPILFKVVFGSLVLLYSKTMKGICQENSNVYFMEDAINYSNWMNKIDKSLSINDLFCDGVHPSELSYGLWGKEIGEFIVKKGILLDGSISKIVK